MDLSAQELYMSHNDFNSSSILPHTSIGLGEFSITRTQHNKPVGLFTHTQLLPHQALIFKIKTGTYVRFFILAI